MTVAALLDRITALSASRRYGLLTLIAILFLTPGLMTLPPVDRDESRFAQASKQMVESGDYLDIRFQDTPRHKKPIGIYWLQAAAVHITGEAKAIAVYRLPSLLGAVLAVLLTAHIGAMLFGSGVGFAAGLLMAASVLLNVEARSAKADAMLLAATLAALACLLRVIRSPAPEGKSAFGFWAAMGVGFLIKGPIPFLPALGVAAVESWRRRGLGWARNLRPLTGILLFLLIAAPWLIAIGVISEGRFFTESLGKDLGAKLLSGQESHGAPPGFYLAMAPVVFWPFSLLGLLALPWIWRQRRRAEVQLLLGWGILTWLVFALTPTKLAHYVLPVYPALAILAAAALVEGRDGSDDSGGGARAWWRWTALTLWGLVTLALGLAMPVLALVSDLVPSDPVHLAGLLLAPMLWAGWRLAVSAGAATPARALPARELIIFSLAACLFSGLIFGRFLPGLNAGFVSPRLVAALPAPPGCAAVRLASTGFREPSLVFLQGADTRLTHGVGAADHLLAEPDCGVAAVEARKAQEFLDRVAANGQKVRAVGVVGGFNYARGQRVQITLYVADGKS